MSTEEKVIKNKVGLLKLSELLGSVSEACKVMLGAELRDRTIRLSSPAPRQYIRGSYQSFHPSLRS